MLEKAERDSRRMKKEIEALTAGITALRERVQLLQSQILVLEQTNEAIMREPAPENVNASNTTQPPTSGQLPEQDSTNI